ncbi:crossover junction endodeoxyribonuclease RuvC [Adlercreutzia sp. ZJ138]|uniref:crossover junction endodeoxyribonuclease RuvC n=1 Tax=Adlercreutzia sp. ZJ138 TaxID=2709405 RepID=UPI0013ED866D|nr:crossover junction endodeoxyribonuclease RuvC [Adlercreutzia sp. ZJ138]
MAQALRTVLGIDPGLANTGWGVVRQEGPRLSCVAYGCVSTDAGMPLARRLQKIHEQVGAVIDRFSPSCVGIETVWFGQNITAAFATGQARGAALVACAEGGIDVGEFTPRQIKLAVVGTGSAEKEQVQYMVRQLLGLDGVPRPDHAADALAAAICYTTHAGVCEPCDEGSATGFDAAVARALARDHVRQEQYSSWKGA